MYTEAVGKYLFRGTPALVRLSILGILSVPACELQRAAQPAASPGSAATANPAADAAPADTSQPSDSEAARIFPGPDSTGSQRMRRKTAVLLFAPPTERSEDAAISSVEALRFQPIACSLRGKLAVGARCGEAMPRAVTVRLTNTGGSLGLQELDLERSTVPFRDGAGSHVYPAPYGPACCMYNTCVGKTVPYLPKRSQPNSVLTTTQTVLAVWPADAEIDLTVFEPGLSAEVKIDAAPWLSSQSQSQSPAAGRAPRLGQTVLFLNRRYSAVASGGMGGSLFADIGSGWQRVLGEPGVRDYYLLSGSDLDGDGRPELLVYARWANDYGLHLLANDAAKPAYSFSCGNI
jgi:hypothetical protein